MSMRKLFREVTIPAVVGYLVIATVDKRWAVTDRLAAQLARFI